MHREGTIHDDALPFDIEVVRYMTNSAMQQEPPEGTTNPANAGAGQAVVAVERPEVSGANPDQEVDVPSAYVTFKNKDTGESLGTYLVSLLFSINNRAQHVTLDGKSYDVSLRFKRTYKPYTLHLLEFKHEKYLGTEIPKNFCSRVRLVDPTRHEDREVEISMNHPLWHGSYNPFFPSGETFYQYHFLPDDRGTVLQVVRNPGWALPYIACFMMAVGLLAHFGISLHGFIMGRVVLPSLSCEWSIGRVVPALLLIPALGCLLLVMMPRSEPADEMHLHEFGKIPVNVGGRVKPMDTLARNSLMIVSGKQSFSDEKGTRQPATKWLLDVMTCRFTKNDAADKHKVFRIENDQVLTLLGLKARAGYRYAFEEFADKEDLIKAEAMRAYQTKKSQRTVFDEKIMELAQHLQLFSELAHLSTLVVPPPPNSKDWLPLMQAINNDPAARSFAELLLAYSANDTGAFNSELAAYREGLERRVPTDARTTRFEVFHNDFDPFLVSMILYLVVFALACFGFLFLLLKTSRIGEYTNRAAFWLAVLALTVHSGGLLARMFIQERAPVTNLYLSAVFVGWACLVIALALEAIFRNGIGNVVASALGFLTAWLASYFAGSSDTMEMMEAVLDTNFWLATHVTCISIGYAATLVAGVWVSCISCCGLDHVGWIGTFSRPSAA